ncbi:MAG: hypothetical protein R3F20_10175 [Planctomycetota bacterium]
MSGLDDDFPPLRAAAGAARGFLQVLVRRLELERREAGLRFRIDLDGDEPALLGNADKRRAAARIDVDEGRALEAALEEFRREARPGERRILEGRDFRFRHASGGALVLVPSADGGGPEPLLFERDIPPVGWNLANGASSSLDELADLDAVIAREAAEELIVLDPEARRLHPLGPARGGDEIARALALWGERLGAAPGAPLAPTPIAGPDVLEVRLPDGRVGRTEGLFVDLQAEDFGLEASRGLRLDVDLGRRVPLDGELRGETDLLDRRVATFAAPPPAAPARQWRSGRRDAGAGPTLRACPAAAKILARLAVS